MPLVVIDQANFAVTLPTTLSATATGFGATYLWSQICGQEISFDDTSLQAPTITLDHPPYPQQVIGVRCKVVDSTATVPGAWYVDGYFYITPSSVTDNSRDFQCDVKLIGGRHIRDFTTLSIKRSIISGNGVISTASLKLPNGVKQNDATVRRNDSIQVDGGLGAATLPIFQGHRINSDRGSSMDRSMIDVDFADDYQRLTIDEHTPTDDDLGYLNQSEMAKILASRLNVSTEYVEGGSSVRSRDDKVEKVSSVITSLSADSGGVYFIFRDGRVHIKREPLVGSDEPDMVLHPFDVDSVSWSDDDFKSLNQVTHSGEGVRYREVDSGHVAANGVIAGTATSDKSQSRAECKEKAQDSISRSRSIKNRLNVQFPEGYRLWPFGIVRLSGFDDDEVNADWIVQDVKIAVSPDSYQSSVTLGRELPRFSQFA